METHKRETKFKAADHSMGWVFMFVWGCVHVMVSHISNVTRRRTEFSSGRWKCSALGVCDGFFAATADGQVGTLGNSPYWYTPWTAVNCVQPGMRQYYSQLFDIKGSWEYACATMPIKWEDGRIFPASMSCEKGWLGMYGYAWIPDETCQPRWGDFADYGCSVLQGYRTYRSILSGVPDGASYIKWCESFGAVVNGITFKAPTR